MGRLPRPTGTSLLLVEGDDDYHVVDRLRKTCEFMPYFTISNKKGWPNLKRSIGGHIDESGQRAVGLLVDANASPERRWREIATELAKVGIDAPSPSANGTIVEAKKDRPRVGVWLMPDNVSPGELEDFVKTMIPCERDPVWPLASGFVESIPAENRKFAMDKADKAKVYAWLATRKDPPRMGSAVSAGDLDLGGELPTAFLGWLRKLFG